MILRSQWAISRLGIIDAVPFALRIQEQGARSGVQPIFNGVDQATEKRWLSNRRA